MTMKLVRTGISGAFLDVSIGAVFFAHNQFWTRTGYEAGTTLAASHAMGSACNFIDDGTVKSRDGRVCEPVEFVELVP